MAKHEGQPDKVLRKNKSNFIKQFALTETLKSELIEKRVFTDNTIEELFMVCN